MNTLFSSSRISIDNVMENTVQYYLAYLKIPVEYIKFDNSELYWFITLVLYSTIDFDNWRSIIEIIKHPTDNFISLLSLFLPVRYFYTVYIQIVVNHLTKLDAANFNYLVKVLSYLPTSKQFPFARFCWRM